MRIIIHSDEYYPTCAACANRMKSFADVFASNGHEVTVIASSANKENGTVGKALEKVLFSPTVKMKKKTTVMRMINNLSYAVMSVFTSFKAGKGDVVITTSPPPLVSISGWLIAVIKRAKLVYDVRDIWPDVALEMGSFSQNSIYYRIFDKITRFMYKHADVITTVSPGKVEKIKEKLPTDIRDKVILVPNGFDNTILDSEIDEELVEKYNLKEGFTCVYIGNIGLAQGLGSVFDVAASTKSKDVKFLFFGTGAEKELLEKQATERGLDNISFCGVIPHEKVYTLLTKASLSFVPLKSSKMKDSIPTKIYESIGVGCPVLLVAEGDSCDIVNESGLGRCVSPDNLSELPNVFDEIVENYEKITRNRDAAKELMKKRFSRQQIAVEFEKKLKEIV